MIPFAIGFLVGAILAVLPIIWVAAETKARNANLHASFEKARRE